MRRLARSTLQTAINLVFFAIVGTTILASVHQLTHDTIAKTEEAAKMKLINQIVPASQFDNDIMRDTLLLPANPLLGTDEATPAYRARLRGQPVAVVLEAIAPDGYAGKIRMVVGVRADGAIAGVRVVAHTETPGLGDYIEIAKDKWITLFDGQSHQATPSTAWKVRKDGGNFDHMAGATVTPRAVIKAVDHALSYFEQHRDALFAMPTPTQEAQP